MTAIGEEKTEPATDHKRQEARERGQVLKSQDVIIAVLVFAITYSLGALGGFWYKTLYGFVLETIESVPSHAGLDFNLAMRLVGKSLIVVFMCTAPVAAIAFLMTWLANLLQVGVLFTTKPLSFEEGIKKLNPIEGFKKIFSMKQVIEVIKAFVKIIVIGWVIYGVIRDALGVILRSTEMHPAGALGFAGTLIEAIGKKVALAMVLIAALDYFLQRWQYEKSLRMSHKEIKEEYKKLEGDPLVKARQRQKQMEMAMSAVRGNVEMADVVITNPTHLAVALAYKPTQGIRTPKVVAKGQDRAALEIRRIAQENFILVVEDIDVARTLYGQVKVDQDIPPELFQAVAKIIAMLFKGRRRPGPARPGAPPPPPVQTAVDFLGPGPRLDEAEVAAMAEQARLELGRMARLEAGAEAVSERDDDGFPGPPSTAGPPV